MPIDLATVRCQDLLEMACKTARLGIFERDFRTGFTSWSRELFEIRGMAPDAGTPSFEDAAANVHPADRPHFDAAMRGSLARRHDPVRRQTFSLRYRICLADGELRHLHKQWVVHYGATGEAEMLLGVVADETPYEALLQSRGVAQVQLDMAAEFTGMAFWRHDTATGEVKLNSHAAVLFNIGPDQVVVPLQRLHAGLHADDRAAAQAADAAALSGGAPVDVELRCRTAAGGWRHLLTRRGVQTSDGGAVVSLVGVAIDITDRVRSASPPAAHDAGHPAGHDAVQQDNLARSRLLARVSHELRTPMNAVLGFAQLLSYEDHADQNASPARRHALRHITDAGQHLLALIDDVLDLSRLQGGEMPLTLQPVCLAPVVASAVSMLAAPVQERGICLQLQGLDTTVLGDARRLRQVVLNLLSNAIKYGRQGGSVVVQAQTLADHVLLQVVDDGHGISEEQLHHLFEPFNRLGAEGTPTQGTGLGLSIVKALVERMGGQVRVQSRRGEGSLFELRLLAAPTATKAAHRDAG